MGGRLSARGIPEGRHPLRGCKGVEVGRLPHRAADVDSGRIVLPKNDRLFGQLVSLERHVARGGHDVIDHPRDQHDDIANAAMGAAVLAASFGGYNLELLRKVTALGPDEPDVEARNRQYRNDLAARVYMFQAARAIPANV